MQQPTIKYIAAFFSFFIFILTTTMVRAQDKIKIDKEGIRSWFEQYWMWVVVGAAVLLLLVVAFSRRSNRGTRIITGGKRKTTTVVEDAQGNTKSITTTEENL